MDSAEPEVRRGQPGRLMLSAVPGRSLPLTVERVTPVAVAEDGHNFFRVEALLDGDAGRLRPGMEGVGKILVDERKLIWIWTRSLADWVSLTLWSRLP